MDIKSAKQRQARTENDLAQALEVQGAITDRLTFLRAEAKGLRLPALVKGESDAQDRLKAANAEILTLESELEASEQRIPELREHVEDARAKVQAAEADELQTERAGLERKALLLWREVWELERQANAKREVIDACWNQIRELNNQLTARGRAAADYRLPSVSLQRQQAWVDQRLRELAA